jgi:hypothetical protein
MPLKKFKTKKQAIADVVSFYEACTHPGFLLFDGKHYKGPDGVFYGANGETLEKFDEATAKFLKNSFIHWLKDYHGEAFKAIK